MTRLDWDSYFLKVAMLVSERATCPRMHCGCVLVKDKNIIATGYNGSLPGHPHCVQIGCEVVDNHCQRTIHSEKNALLQAAKLGHSCKDSTAYVTNLPCYECSKALIMAGIKRVVIFGDYHCHRSLDNFKKAGIDVIKLNMPEKKINYEPEKYSSAKKDNHEC